MNPIKILEKKTNCILYELPAGKPDSNQPCQKEVEQRDRVMQQAQKGLTCWYYAINRIRRRVGKFPEPEITLDRQIEVLGSNWRKENTAFRQSLPSISDDLGTKHGNRFFLLIDRNEAEWILKLEKPVITAEHDGTPSLSDVLFEYLEECTVESITLLAFIEYEKRPSLATLLSEFVLDNKHENMCDFLNHKIISKQIEINKKLIYGLGSNPKDLEDDIQGMQAVLPEFYDDFMSRDLYEFAARSYLASAYHLRKSDWTPYKDIEYLIKQLTLNGPLVVGGDLGREFYIDEPTNKEIVNGKEIYSWKPNSKRKIGLLGHNVVIVGAKKVKDVGLVYFIDPIELSDPSHPESQKCYKISYKNLTKNVYDSFGMQSTLPHESGELAGYGYHGHFKI